MISKGFFQSYFNQITIFHNFYVQFHKILLEILVESHMQDTLSGAKEYVFILIHLDDVYASTSISANIIYVDDGWWWQQNIYENNWMYKLAKYLRKINIIHEKQK